MAVTGQFGKVITGSGSVASAISGIASNYITLRLNRIYDAFINKESFEGREVTAAVAIELLNKLMATTSKGGKSESDVQETLRAVRKASRTRTLNEIDGKLKEEGATGDYANKVRVIREMLLDPTLNPDDISDLKDELTDAVDDLLTNAQNQFSSGGKIKINGRTIDFANGANESELMALFDDAIKEDPASAEKLSKQRVTAQASVLVAKANAAWLAKTRTTDSEKNAGYTEQLKYLREAYTLLNTSKYGLTTEAQNVLTSIRNIEENQATARKNISGTSATNRMNSGYDNIFGDLDAIDAALKKDPTIAAMFGDKTTFATYLSGDQNYALQILDAYIAGNGNSITREDGSRISLTIENISDIMKDARAGAAALYKWSKNNPNLSESAKETIKSWDTYSTALGKAAPILTTEDKYDDAVDDLSKAMDAAGADIGARAAALRAFGKTLNTLAAAAGLPAGVAAALRAEANVYTTGQRPGANVTLYGDYSGNLSVRNGISGIYNLEEILGGVILPQSGDSQISIYSAITTIFSQEADWTAGNGTINTDIDGNDTPGTAGQDTAAWEKGQGVILKTIGTVTLEGGTKLNTFVDQNLQRIRLVSAGLQSDPDNVGNFTEGWVTRVKDKNGAWQYVVTTYDKTTKVERLLKGDAANAFVRNHLNGGNWNALIQNIGGNAVITLGSRALDGYEGPSGRVNGLKGSEVVGDAITPTKLVDGTLWGMLTDPNHGYGWANEYQSLVDESIRLAVKNGKLAVRGGRIYIINGKKIGGAQGEALVDLDITGMVSEEMRLKIIEIAPTVDTQPGEREGDGGAADTSGDTGAENRPTGKDRWAGTQWAGQEGSTVISKTASGKDLTLDEAFSSGTGYMWDNAPKKTGGGGGGVPMVKPKLDPRIQAEYDRLRAQGVKSAGMRNVVTGKTTTQLMDEGQRILTTAFRNLPAGSGTGKGSTPATGTRAVAGTRFAPIQRNKAF